MSNDLISIEQKIYEVRGQRVMLDFDLAELYQVETKVLNQSVKRNIRRFPSDFMFQLTKEECSRSQIVTLNTGRGSNIKYLPYAFTEQGVAMLSSVLHSNIAIKVNISIMRAFVAIKNHLAINTSSSREIEELKREVRLIHASIGEMKEDIASLDSYQENNDKQLDDLFNAFAKLSNQIQVKTAQLESKKERELN
ncbi:hypothetical protein EZS27_001916 [termite gut metagenome]|uniref:KilA-N DNA-binding domain-containing protein n=1 Tax=termite gut metagenome TaxID=433724 RepID=A0A5J4SXT6_9ZZZZ